jgi:spermidine/putrescine transport system permease protein
MKKFFAQTYLWVLLALLYAPIIIIGIFSFTEAKVLGNWTGFSTKLYTSLFSGGVRHNLLDAIENTFTIALIAAAVSTILGSIAAIGIHNMRGKKRQAITFLNNVPMLNPDIITGISLFLLFITLGISQGYMTVVLAHIAFCTPYVVLSVMPRLQQMDPNLYEAALDLGCHPIKALFKVILPEIMPGVVTGSLLAFTMSLDDFVISYFTSSTDQNLSMIVYSAARRGVEPTMYALSTLMFLSILVLLLIVNRRSNLEDLSK